MSDQTLTAPGDDAVDAPAGRRIGVYVCHCGGNISDYVDVEKVAQDIRDNGDVIVSRTTMFACSDASQQDIEADIRANQLDGLVVASCSPKLHTYTFRGVAQRAGLNPYEYTQVNIREQCSWVHTDDHDGATAKATALVNAGIGRTRNTVPLEPMVVDTVPHTLVIGGGIAGLRAAVGLADIGLRVTLVERELVLGGWVKQLGRMYPHNKDGHALIEELVAQVKRRPSITVLTGAEVVGKAGSFGNFRMTVRVGGEGAGTIEVLVGSIVVATGFDAYAPAEGELGFGIDGVVTLPQFKELVDAARGPLSWQGRPVRTIAYVYCVGSRNTAGCANAYCSRFCCASTVQTAVEVSGLDPSVRQFHLYRDMRTYGKFEPLYTEARDKGSVFLKFDNDEPPAVAEGPDGRLTVTVRDLLTERTELAIPVDLVVLVTGMVPRENQPLIDVLKVPKGADGFFNEIHPKLRPVETVVDGVLIAGASQGPKTSSESVAQALAAVTQSAAILKKGFTELDPLVAIVDSDSCTACGDCLTVCPYDAIAMHEEGDHHVAVISAANCKGCGGCVPICPENAIDLLGYTDAQITDMISSLAEVPV
ncbi:MAG: CoB--CoM heterodisulfide reductase iron-sulfur subunit A family protein [Candidatus Limnocylindrales bacterium]